MAVIVASSTGLSVTANATSADQVTGTYQFLNFTLGSEVALSARSSATGMNLSLTINGQTIINDQAVPCFGTSGALSMVDHLITDGISVPPNARCELKFRNTTAGTLTVDFKLEAEAYTE